MKYDSYPRFLKSDMYKDCTKEETQGKLLSFSAQKLLKYNEEKSNILV